MYMYKDIVSGWNLRNQMSPTFHIGIQEFEEFTAPTRILPQPWCLVQKPRSWRISWGLSRLSNLQNLKIWCYYIYISADIYIYINICYFIVVLISCIFSFVVSDFSEKKTSQQFPMASHHQPRGSPAPCRLASNTRYCRCLCNLEPTRAIIQWVTAVASCLELSETVPNSIFSPFKMELEPWLTILVFK
jgi:hypothetical protein